MGSVFKRCWRFLEQYAREVFGVHKRELIRKVSPRDYITFSDQSARRGGLIVHVRRQGSG